MPCLVRSVVYIERVTAAGSVANEMSTASALSVETLVRVVGVVN